MINRNTIALLIFSLAIPVSGIACGQPNLNAPVQVKSSVPVGKDIPAKTEDKVTELVKGARKAAKPLLEKGDQALLKGDFNQAVHYYWKANRTCPMEFKPYYELCRIMVKVRQFDSALRLLEEAGPYTDLYPSLYQSFLTGKWDYPEDVIAPANVSIALFKDNKSAALSLLFCDGDKTFVTHALPILKEYGIKAQVAVITSKTSEHTVPQNEFGSWDYWREAERQGYPVCNHTISHAPLNAASADELENEVNGAYKIITEEMNNPPTCFVFPGQDTSDDASLKKAYEKHTVVIQHDALLKVYDRIFLPYYGGLLTPEIETMAVDFAIQNHLWMIPLCHGVSDGEKRLMHRPITQEFLRKHLADLQARQDEIWVDTATNIYLYLYERKNAQIKVKKTTKKSVTFVVNHSLDSKIFVYPLTMMVNLAADSRVSQARAWQGSVEKQIPVMVEHNKLLLNVVPNTDAVTVQWD